MKTTEEAADMVLRAAGSSLKNYTMPATREAIFAAVREIQRDAVGLNDEYSKDEIIQTLKAHLAVMIMYAENYLEEQPESRGRSIDDKDAWQGHLTQVSCSISQATSALKIAKEHI